MGHDYKHGAGRGGGGYHHRDSAVIAPKPTALDNKIHPHDGVMGRSYLR